MYCFAGLVRRRHFVNFLLTCCIFYGLYALKQARQFLDRNGEGMMSSVNVHAKCAVLHEVMRGRKAL